MTNDRFSALVRAGKRAAIVGAMVLCPLVADASTAAADGMAQRTATQTVDYYIDRNCVNTDLNSILWILRNNQLPDWYVAAATLALNAFRNDPYDLVNDVAVAGGIAAPWAYAIAADCSR